MSLVMVEFALIYGNDWFIVPVELDIGSLTRIRSLKVIDSFGETITIPPFTSPAAPAGAWRMFSLATDARYSSSGAAHSDFLFLPPTLGPSLHGQPVEEVVLMRDEMANLAWAIEHIVENGAGARVDRRDAYQQQHETPAPPTANEYRLSTEVPDYWIPLVPVRQATSRASACSAAHSPPLRSAGPARPQGRIMGTPGPFCYSTKRSRAAARALAPPTSTRAGSTARPMSGAADGKNPAVARAQARCATTLSRSPIMTG